MKNFLFYLIIVMLLPSCTYYVQPKYTKVDKIIKLTPGMGIQEVNNTLGIEPYDVYTIQKSGRTILVYHYKRKQRKYYSANDLKEEGLTEERGYPLFMKPSKLYVMFDQNSNMASLWTEDGTDNAIKLIQIDQQARRYLSATMQENPMNDQLLFTTQNEKMKKDTTQAIKKKGKAVVVLTTIGLAIITTAAIILTIN